MASQIGAVESSSDENDSPSFQMATCSHQVYGSCLKSDSVSPIKSTQILEDICTEGGYCCMGCHIRLISFMIQVITKTVSHMIQCMQEESTENAKWAGCCQQKHLNQVTTK